VSCNRKNNKESEKTDKTDSDDDRRPDEPSICIGVNASKHGKRLRYYPVQGNAYSHEENRG
jgi:hypothetical protein